MGSENQVPIVLLQEGYEFVSCSEKWATAILISVPESSVLTSKLLEHVVSEQKRRPFDL